jgi:hypothetical protein
MSVEVARFSVIANHVGNYADLGGLAGRYDESRERWGGRNHHQIIHQ